MTGNKIVSVLVPADQVLDFTNLAAKLRRLSNNGVDDMKPYPLTLRTATDAELINHVQIHSVGESDILGELARRLERANRENEQLELQFGSLEDAGSYDNGWRDGYEACKAGESDD